MKTRLLIILSLIAFTIPFSDADASCASFIPVLGNVGAYTEASVVFYGTVTQANEPHKPDLEVIGLYPEYTTFEVHHVFKGQLLEDKVTTNPGSSVGYDGFEKGKTYFVYAYGPANEVNLCTAPASFPLALLTLIFHFPFLLIPLGFISGIVIVWRKRK
ncbi:MAG: hypothetical protein ACE5DL_01645 [Nitrosopumilaceae archaeon]